MPREKESTRKWPQRPPNTGVRLPKELVVRAKHRALDESLTLRELIQKALETYLSRHP